MLTQSIIGRHSCGRHALLAPHCRTAGNQRHSCLKRYTPPAEHFHAPNSAGASTPQSTSPADPKERLSTQALTEWNSCLQLLSNLGFSKEDADKYITRAFGWSTQAYWRSEKVEVAPDAAQVQAVIDFLSNLEIQGPGLLKVVKAFPEVLACDVNSRLAANVKCLENQYKLSGPVLTQAVLRQPQVLGYTVDCGGDCVGECNRCWVRF